MPLLLVGVASLGPILVALLIICLFLAGVYYLITKFVPEPMKGYAIAIVVVIAIIVAIYALAPYAAGR